MPVSDTQAGPHSLAELVVDLGAVAHNVRRLRALAAPARLMAVVKADGYNMGARAVALTALDHGADELGVATVGEGLDILAVLRDAGRTAPVTAWMWYPGEPLDDAVAAGLTLGIPSLEHARALTAVAADRGRPGQPPVRATLMADTGLSRSGIAPGEWGEVLDLVAAAARTGSVEVTGVMSHLSGADDATSPATDIQATRFRRAIDDCRARGLDVPVNHLANTPATLTRPDLRFDMVRPGVGVYGVDPCAGGGAGDGGDGAVGAGEPGAGGDGGRGLRPVATLRARVTTTRLVPRGESVGYGGLWTADRDTRTAVVAIGYADGIPRALTGAFDVTVRGRRYRQIGRVSMDQIVIDLGPADGPEPEVRPGDWAVIFGEGGATLSEVARALGTIDYEVLTLPRTRVRRRYIPAGEGEGAGAGGVDGRKGDAAGAVGAGDGAGVGVGTETPVNPGAGAGDGAGVGVGTETPVNPGAPDGTVAVPTAEAMRQVGEAVGRELRAGDVVVLTGPLGAGKTTLTQGIARGMGVTGRVQSPTFTVVREHRPSGDGPGLLHMDAYRLLDGLRDDDAHGTGGTGAAGQPEETGSAGQGAGHGVSAARSAAVLDALESLDLDGDLTDHALVAEWGEGVVEPLGTRVLHITLTRDGVDTPGDDEARTLAWRWTGR
ncbi:tRNA (adenosine(37)-N6)-threonylcarbamoyltransferase complex ATPase subunit type 1 TsaE [Corynebacterium bovis]|uniref:Alanine racemase n=1 Tax=Corynebacterium bovis DSM 20582 = CIP 54.80 TaxID=927655 RepID=A0A8I0CMC6_9CORY|nr:tRNA (adenosine(37)-N6)-threonylcarbamoyltransferase complex ATPase subunit type 1 TsaE [Corynebacterium bovis]MBB3115559.1 alanine racemase [Corynebacterium bovis DSM 20582 = CIP 54.80]QQC47289.1 tRNA (adenosine(37)-N6)-threonylcarbamoyltransferase complex ATPase subunit type 1 TsaE [Corynebacterium bovis]WJY76985.1 Alanine racemase [Corynebacterium bovis DSM 20582 = CIP 54.80]